MSDISVTVTSDIKEVMHSHGTALRKALSRGVLRAAQFARGELVKEIGDKFNTRTGKLQRSFRASLTEDTESSISAGAYSDLIYSQIQDEGGTITSKNGKMLAVPVSPEAKSHPNKWPRYWEKGRLFFMKGAGGGFAGLFEVHKGRGKFRSFILHYVLKRSVKIKGRHYIDAARDATAPIAQDIISQAAIAALEGGQA